MKLFELLEDISYCFVGKTDAACLEREITRVSADPRRVQAQALFVCVRVAMGDGHDSASAAYGMGCRTFLAERDLHLPEDAAVLVVEDSKRLLGLLAARCCGHPGRSLTVFGITGTAGKSAVAHTLTALLRESGRSFASLSVDGVDINGTLRPAGAIVPNGADIQELLLEFVSGGVEFAVLEFSSYMLSNHAHIAIPFTALLLSDFDPAYAKDTIHADSVAYREAKASLFEGGAPFLAFPAKFADFCASDPLPDTRRLTFGAGGDLQAIDIAPFTERSGFGTRFTLCFENGEKEAVSLPVPGDMAVENALGASLLALVAGLSLKQIATGLSHYKPLGRLECIGAYEGRYIYADTAYAPLDLARALDTLRPYTEGRLSALIGSVGGRARKRRRPLGKAAADHADFVYLTADNPDCEDPVAICEEMMLDMEDASRCCIISDRRTAILRAVREMRPGDTLLLAGKGAEDFQLIRGVRERFCEREIVADALCEI